MRRVPRRVTAPRTVPSVPLLRSIDFDVESGVDTLMKRFRAVKVGDSLYPWSRTKLVNANGKRRWVAKEAADYYHEEPFAATKGASHGH